MGDPAVIDQRSSLKFVPAPGLRDPDNWHHCAPRRADGWHRSTCPGTSKTTWCWP
jgi:hypothetical protein